MAYQLRIDNRQRAVAVAAAVLLPAAAMIAVAEGLAVTGPRDPFPLRERWPTLFDVPVPIPVPAPPPCVDCWPPEPPVPPRPLPPPQLPVQPIDSPATWLTMGDYPARDLREGNQGMAAFKLTVGPTGRVQDCAITRSSGFTGLDAAVCWNVTRRARFRPAIDAKGKPTMGVYRGKVRWLIPN